MKRISLRSMQERLTEYFALFLTIAGVLFAIMLTLGQLSGNQQGTALIFLIWLQGVILWAAHRHERLQRRALIHKLQHAVNELVSDRLVMVVRNAELNTRSISGHGRDPEAEFGATLEALSEEFESLRAWERQLQVLRA
jgi:hypothetical protein